MTHTEKLLRADSGGEPRPWKRALLWLAFLGPFFFLSYGFANWWTAQLGQVASLAFKWETHIPFLDWTIFPYMSIDALYAASLFLCMSRAELDAHARRLFSATLISVTGFLLFPLQFSFIRPVTSGLSATLFDLLTSFDKPFNQAPSLHISLLMLLWVVYARHLRGATLWLMHFWFVLIGISVFTTYQHHAIDGITGAIVGIVCLYLFPDLPRAWSREVGSDIRVRRRLHMLYLVGAIICMVLALLLQSWAWLLLWPAVALLLVSLAYARFGASIFQKHQGRQSWAARTLLMPYRCGAWLSSRWFTRKDGSGTEVVPGIWIGRAPGRSDWPHLAPLSVLDLTAEFNAGGVALACRYLSVPMLDLAMPSARQLQQAVNALDALYTLTPVLVHCALGYSRSALVVAAWLMHRGLAATPEEAVALLDAAGRKIVLPQSYRALLNGVRLG